MPSSRIPEPPPTDNPIVFLRELSRRQEFEFLHEFAGAYETGDVDRAASCAIAALDTPMERKLVGSLVSSVNNLAYTKQYYSSSVTALLCKAADKGHHTFAYNAANQLMTQAKTPEDYKKAEHYYKLAMALSEQPTIQAAAHVNYCPIIRDGLISGKPDWPAAVEIYEAAARMGLVKGMFNAGNVCDWLASRGDRTYGARAAYWFQYALEHRAAGKPRLDMETLAELDDVFQSCRVGLSACHIDSKFDEADLEEGIRWAKEAAQLGSDDARYNLGIGYTERLARLAVQPQRSPGANWRSVLAALDWSFEGTVETIVRMLPLAEGERLPVRLDKLTVRLADNSTIPLYITHDPCLPCDSAELLQAILANLIKSGNPRGFLLLPRKALFVQLADTAHTPIYAYREGEFGMQSLGMTSSPDEVLRDLQDEIEFEDPRRGASTCMISIAVNALDEGYVVADHTTYAQRWAGVGGPFRMPFVSENKLMDLGILLRR